jgi:hypothetical protein
MELHSLVPSAVRDTILKAVHDNPFAGHLGITRTEERVRKLNVFIGLVSVVTLKSMLSIVQYVHITLHQLTPLFFPWSCTRATS